MITGTEFMGNKKNSIDEKSKLLQWASLEEIIVEFQN